LSPELREAYVCNRLRQMMVLEHAGYVQVLNHHDCLGFRQSAGELMQRIGTLMGDPAMQLREFADRLLAIAAAFVLAGNGALQSLELLEARA